MPIARGDKEYRLPVKGLNTEVNILDFPQDYAVDITNMLLDFDPVKLRPRKGLTAVDVTNSSVVTLTTPITIGDPSLAHSTHLWERVGEDVDRNILCIQQGDTIFFLDADANVVSISEATYSVTGGLDGANGTTANMLKTPYQYSSVKGHLLITSPITIPTLLRFNPDTGDIEVAWLHLKVRDTLGLDSGVPTDRRPTAISEFPTTSRVASAVYTPITEVHEYNLYNQGWYEQRRLSSGSKTKSDPIAEFFTQNSAYPSSADIPYLGMVDSSGDLIFDAEYLIDLTFGSSPAARGHYVLDAFDMNRANKIITPSESGATTGGGGGSLGGADASWGNQPP